MWTPPRRALRRAAAGASAVAISASLLAAAGAHAALPPWWPRTLQIGLADAPGDAGHLRAQAPFGVRYQYLAGGVGTGSGWSTWDPGATFASSYARESRRASLVPVFSYYMVNGSAPGLGGPNEAAHDLAVLRSASLMRELFADFRLLMQRLSRAGGPAMVQVEPDLWGYIELGAQHDDASSVPVAVASTGDPELRGLPDNASGLARALLRVQRDWAPHVALGYHLSMWGTGTDPLFTPLSGGEISTLAARSARFYRSLRAAFTVSFAETSDRDADFNRIVRGRSKTALGARAFSRHRRYLAVYRRRAGTPVVLWQIPVGNRVMKAENDTWGHYQSDEVQWFLGPAARRHLRAYRDSGVVAILFGGGADGTTCACDADHDGVRNPPAIDGNAHRSLSADDDGGYLKQRVRAYYRAGALPLPRRG